MDRISGLRLNYVAEQLDRIYLIDLDVNNEYIVVLFIAYYRLHTALFL